MKKIFYLGFLISIIFLSSCESSLKSLRSGEYADAIRISVEKLRKDPNNQKEILVLEEAYLKIHEKDMALINSLKKSGNPDIWDHIFNMYSSIQRRQEMVKALPSLHILNPDHIVVFPFIETEAEIRDAREKAASYHYAHASASFEKGGRQNARDAYDEFLLVKNYFKEFKDLDNMLQKTREAGTSYILINLENQSDNALPSQFEKEIFRMSTEDLDRKWMKFHAGPRTGFSYDYQAKMKIRQIDISPESVKEAHFPHTADIEDGWEYQLDKKGNVMKDANGNDIKIMNMIRVQCDYVEIMQRKSARVSGDLDLLEQSSGRVLRSIPVVSEVLFEYPSAAISGDFRALGPGIRKNLRPMAAFPNNAELILQAAATMKNSIGHILRDNREVFN